MIEDAQLGFYVGLQRRERDADADVGAGRRVRGRAQGGAREGEKE